MVIRKSRPFSQAVHPNIDCPESNSVYIGDPANHYCADIVEEFLLQHGILKSCHRWSNGDFLGYTLYWREERLVLRFSLGRDFRGQLYFIGSVGFALLPEGEADRAFATAYLLREAASIIAPVAIIIELVDLVALKFAMHTMLLTPSHVEHRLAWLVNAAKFYRESLTAPNAHRGSVLAPFPDSYFDPAA